MVYHGIAKIVRSTGLPRYSALGGDGIGSTRNSLDAFRDTLPTVIPAVGEKRYRDDFSCVQRLFFSKVNTATVRVLTANGCEVVIPKLCCCAALPEHQGQAEQASASST